MNLYLISQYKNKGYDTYDAAVVAAETEDDARTIIPIGLHERFNSETGNSEWYNRYTKQWEQERFITRLTWAPNIKYVSVELIGTAEPGTERGVILASFNAG